MNQKNVTALAALIREWNERPRSPVTYDVAWPEGREPVEMYLAQFLASRGCLVPASLTDADCMTIHNAGSYAHTYDAAKNRRAIEAIARGEPPEGERPR